MWEVARLCGWNKVSFWSLLYSNALQTANQTNFWHFSSFVPLQRIREHRRHRQIHTVNPANMLFIEFDGAVKPVGRIHEAIYKTFSAHTRRASSSYLTLCCVPAPPFHRTPYTAPPSFMKLLSSAGIQLLLLLHLFFDLSAKTDALENSQSPSIRCREPWMCVYPNGYNRKPKVWRKYAQHKWRMEIHLIMAFRNRRQENETIFGYMQTERERMRGDQHRQLGRRTLH